MNKSQEWDIKEISKCVFFAHHVRFVKQRIHSEIQMEWFFRASSFLFDKFYYSSTEVAKKMRLFFKAK